MTIGDFEEQQTEAWSFRGNYSNEQHLSRCTGHQCCAKCLLCIVSLDPHGIPQMRQQLQRGSVPYPNTHPWEVVKPGIKPQPSGSRAHTLQPHSEMAETKLKQVKQLVGLQHRTRAFTPGATNLTYRSQTIPASSPSMTSKPLCSPWCLARN